MPASGYGKPLTLRLFLEGQEVPVIAASINIGINAPASASLQVIPLDEGMDLKPRTMVHLFFLDSVPTEVPPSQFDQNQRAYYKLLYSGEVIGFSFAQTPQSRNLVLQCLDFSSYWDACHATAIEYGPGGNAFYNQSAVYAANASLFDDIVNFQSERIASWVTKTPVTPGLQSVSGLAGGIIAMLEAMGGATGTPKNGSPQKFKGVNDFFTVAQLRCKLLEQITAEEKDNSAANILKGKVFDEWLRTGLQNIGQQVTFRDMVKLLCSYIYYDFVPNPAAKYEPDIAGSTERVITQYQLNQSPVAIQVMANLKNAIDDLQGLADATTAHQFKNTTTPISKELKTNASKIRGLGSSGISFSSQIQAVALALDARINNNANLESDVAKSVGQSITGSPFDIVQKASADLNSVILNIQQNAGSVNISAGVNSTATTARLRSQIFRPDCFFAPAPRCNVIFPEHFVSVAYDRTFLTEVTRSLTLVYNTLIGRDMMFADAIMAPNIGLNMKKIQRQTGASGYRLLMPHERHTGIIPRSEWLPNTASFDKSISSDRSQLRGARLTWADKAALFHFFKYRFGPRRINVSGRFNPNVVCGFPGVVILKPFIPDPTILAKALNESTGSQLNTGITIDSGSKEVLNLIQSNGTSTTKLGAPFQMVGMVGNVTHTLGQDGGQTSIAMHHARRHLGVDDEFVGIFSTTSTTVTRRIKVPITSDQAFAQVGAKDRDSLLKFLVGVTPQSAFSSSRSATKTVSSTRSVQYQRFTIESVQTLSVDIPSTSEIAVQTTTPPITSGRIDGVSRNVNVPNPPGKLTTGSKGPFNGTIVGVEVVDPTLVPVTVGTYRGNDVYSSVVLHLDLHVNVEFTAPIEEVIRPGWFSKNYGNSKIGDKIYEPFFGTTSIIDNLKFTGLIEEDINTVEDPEGSVYDPTQKLEAVLTELQNATKTRSLISIEKAINILAYLYGLSKTNGKDVEKFISEYTDRPIATMLDILGSSDLSISYRNTKPTINAGTVGFHSLALDRFAIGAGNLTGLLDDPTEQLPRINGAGKKEAVSPVYDVRGEKLTQVDAYIQALEKGVGQQG